MVDNFTPRILQNRTVTNQHLYFIRNILTVIISLVPCHHIGCVLAVWKVVGMFCRHRKDVVVVRKKCVEVLLLSQKKRSTCRASNIKHLRPQTYVYVHIHKFLKVISNGKIQHGHQSIQLPT